MKITGIIRFSLTIHIVLNHIARNATAWLSKNYHVTNICGKTFHQSYYHPSHFLNPTTTSTKTSIWSKKQQNNDSINNNNNNNKIKTNNNSKKKKVVTKITNYNSNDSTSTLSSLSIKPIRINKVLKIKYSRRETDTLISKGLITVNNKIIKLGCKVIPYKDKIKVNGANIKHWEQYIINNDDGINDSIDLFQDNVSEKMKKKKGKQEQGKHEYIKYWKPKGVQCSIDSSIENNILQRIQQKDRYIPKRRIFPVGYLDRDTSGLILLTSDERVSKAIFKGIIQQPKTYKVYLDKPISNQDIRILKNGVKITKDTNKYRYKNNNDNDKTTENNANNNNNNSSYNKNYKNNKPLPTIKTNPCTIRTTSSSSTILEITITDNETKNHRRQIPKMLFSLGYKVTKIHRINFCGIKLGKLKQSGEWIHLNDSEMRLVDGVISLCYDDDVGTTSTAVTAAMKDS